MAGEQLRGDALRFLLDRRGKSDWEQCVLRAQELIEAPTEGGPAGLRDEEVATEIEQGALADAGADAFGADQAVGEVAFAVGGGASLGTADEHG